MEKLTFSKQLPPKNGRGKVGQRHANIKYGDVYEYVRLNPNEWLKIEPLSTREAASIRQYYASRHISVSTRLEKLDNHCALYIRWDVLS